MKHYRYKLVEQSKSYINSSPSAPAHNLKTFASTKFPAVHWRWCVQRQFKPAVYYQMQLSVAGSIV